MNGWPTISVVTPSFNQGPFLEETIRSVVSQGYPTLEYLVMDGGSTDESVAVIRRHASQIAHWESRPDQGQSDAINRGWQRSTGDILAYLNSDDLYLPGCLTRVGEYFRQHPETQAVYGPLRMIDAAGRVLRSIAEPPRWSPERCLFCLPQQTVFFRRTVLQQVGFLDARLHYSMDFDYYVRMALAGIAFVRISDEPLACIRIWEGAKSSDRGSQGLAEDLGILDRAAADPRLPRDARTAFRFAKASAYLWPTYQRYVEGDIVTARRFLLEALRLHPPILAERQFLGLLGRTLLGPRGSRMARRLRAGAWGAAVNSR